MKSTRHANPNCIVQLTVEVERLLLLRQLVTRVCGDTLRFMRIALCADRSKIKVLLCIQPCALAAVLEALEAMLPQAQLGEVREVVVRC